MITRVELKEAYEKALKMMESAWIHMTEAEKTKITAADFGLSRLKEEGLQILTMFETDRCFFFTTENSQ
jgi:hypothetical protein